MSEPASRDVESEESEKSEKSGKTECRTGVQNEVQRCPKWLLGRVMLRHNRDRKTVAIPQPRDNPPMGSKHNMQYWCPKCVKCE